jgi:hypothetical protein
MPLIASTELLALERRLPSSFQMTNRRLDAVGEISPGCEPEDVIYGPQGNNSATASAEQE